MDEITLALYDRWKAAILRIEALPLARLRYSDVLAIQHMCALGGWDTFDGPWGTATDPEAIATLEAFAAERES